MANELIDKEFYKLKKWYNARTFQRFCIQME